MVDSINRVTSALQSAREITMEAANVAASKFGESSYRQYSQNITASQLKTLLNSKYTSEVKDGMKRILTIMASHDKTIDASLYFADVVKNIVSPDFKVKSMVSLYLQRYAETEPDLALLPINSIQKSLNDTNPRVRALALKSLSDIKIPTIYPMVIHTLNKSVSDVSPMVRNEVCFALLKLFREKREEVEEDVLSLLKILLSDSDSQVISSAIVLFKECFPSKLELFHGHFRYFVETIGELDSWSQVYLIEILIRYIKHYLPRPIVLETNSTGDLFEGSREMKLPETFGEIDYQFYKATYHTDLNNFLNEIVMLKYSQNPAVKLSIYHAYISLSTPQRLEKTSILEALIKTFTISDNNGVKLYILKAISGILMHNKVLFKPYLKKFYLLPADTTDISTLKLNILASMVDESNIKDIVREIKYYISNLGNTKIIAAASEVIIVCGNISEAWEGDIMKWLIGYINNNVISTVVLDCLINILRTLILNNPKSHMKAIIKLSHILETQLNLADNARAGIVWLFGEVARIEFRICPDILRKLIPNFSNEGSETRCQILSFAAKLLSYDIDKYVNDEASEDEQYNFSTSRIYSLYQVVVELSTYDESVDIRDRARYITSIFDSKKYKIATLLFQAPRQLVQKDSKNEQNVLKSITPTLFSEQFSLEHLEWNKELLEDTTLLREPCARREYSKFQKSFSSEYFLTNSKRASIFGGSQVQSTDTKLSTSEFTNNQGKKYRLQSLDEFFADIPTKEIKPKRRIIVQEESASGEDNGTEDEDDEDDEEESSSDSNSLSSSSSSL